MKLLDTVGGYAQVYPVRQEGSFLVSRCEVPGYYDFWRYEYGNGKWELRGGLTYQQPVRRWEAWGFSCEWYDESGERLEYHPYADTDDFIEAIDALWQHRYTA